MSGNNYLSIYAKSFSWAGVFLPKKIYFKCSNLYDFCRTIDNIADDEGEIEIKRNNFLRYDEQTYLCYLQKELGRWQQKLKKSCSCGVA